jgi:hypothetical protein
MSALLTPDIERAALAHDPGPVEGMRVTGRVVNGMFTSKHDQQCHYCMDLIPAGDRHRVLSETIREQIGKLPMTIRRWCPACVVAMAHAATHPEELQARYDQGERKLAEAPVEFEEYCLVEWQTRQQARCRPAS